MDSIEWHVSDPELGVLERVGLVGIAMSLEAAEEFGADLPAFDYTVSQRSVRIEWPEHVGAADFVVPFYEWAFRPAAEIGEYGVTYIPAIHGAKKHEPQKRLDEHQGLANTFLQHPLTQPQSEVVRGELHIEGESVGISYKPFADKFAYHKNFRDLFYLDLADFPGIGASTAEKIRERVGDDAAILDASLNELQEVRGISQSKAEMISEGYRDLRDGTAEFSSFFFPGATSRYGGEPSWSGSPTAAIPLFFAPAACYYLRLDFGEWVVVAPEVRNIRAHATLRRADVLGNIDAHARSPADAGLRVTVASQTKAASIQLEDLTGKPMRCEVFKLGDIDWRRQTVRSRFERIEPTQVALEGYKQIEQHLDNRVQIQEDEEKDNFVTVPDPRGPIADNLAAGRPWYTRLFLVPEYLRDSVDRQSRDEESTQRCWFRLLDHYHSDSLREIMNAMNDIDPQKPDEIFVEAFHQTMRNRFRQEAEQAERGSRSAGERMKDFIQDTRRDIMRANTRNLLRKTLSEFFSKGDYNPVLREHKSEVWNFIDSENEWRRARDLALLSLVTYQGKGEEELEGEVEGDEAVAESTS